MNLKKRLAAMALAALSTLGGAAPALAQPGADTLSHHPSMPLSRRVTVTGEGEAIASPDRARLILGVSQLDADLRAAEGVVNDSIRKLLSEAKSLGAKDAQIASTGASIQPEYQWDEPNRRQVLVGYRVRRQVSIEVTDLTKLGDYLLRATKAGVNEMQPPQLESSKATSLRQQALAAAARDAQTKAELLARTLGARLGPVRSIQAGEAIPPPPGPVMAMAMRGKAESFDSGNEEMGLSAGEIRYTATVSAEFELLTP